MCYLVYQTVMLSGVLMDHANLVLLKCPTVVRVYGYILVPPIWALFSSVLVCFDHAWRCRDSRLSCCNIRYSQIRDCNLVSVVQTV